MPLSATHCLAGVKVDYTREQHHLNPSYDDPQKVPPERGDAKELRPVTYHGLRGVSTAMLDDPWLVGPPPSDLELHEKARSLGIHPPTIELYARYSKKHAIGFTNSAASFGTHNKLAQSSLVKFDQENVEDVGAISGSIMKSKLPRIPVIRHTFQGSIPTTMRSDTTTTTMLPECITALSPRAKSSAFDISQLERRFLPPPKPTLNDASPSAAPSAKRRDVKRDKTTRGSRIVVSPKSKEDMQARPGVYYGRRYPLVILDSKQELPGKPEIQINTSEETSNSNSHMNPRHSLPAISTSLPETSSGQDAGTSRSRAEAIPVEQFIQMSASQIRPTHPNISAWFPELACKPKMLHSKSLDDTRR